VLQLQPEAAHIVFSNVYANSAGAWLERIRVEIAKVIFGQTEVVDAVLICLVAGGHILLEGAPGLGKTKLLRTLADVLDLGYSRIQFTPDLMPGDIIGSMTLESDLLGQKTLAFQKGPVFSNLVLADEINRASPRTQAALLEAMQERTITVGNETYQLDSPFFVMATQNPIEMEGTYPLPEAQLDRFLMKVLVPYPTRQNLIRIVEATKESEEPHLSVLMTSGQVLEMRRACRQLIVAPHVEEFAVDLIMATQPGTPGVPAVTNRYIRYGSSPRGAQALIECGRVRAASRGELHLSIEDILAVAPAVLRHRIIPKLEAYADGQSIEATLGAILAEVVSRRR
jgi:MoxR-like ATPase